MTPKTPRAERLTGLPPVVSSDMAVLLLGSFPGVASLRARQYYGHPRNHFWRILQAMWPQHPLPAGPNGYADRCHWLLDRRLGVWDVYASCVREGSLDTSIRDAVVNDFALLRAHCPRLTAIAHNGAESYKHAPQVLRSLQAHAGAARGAPIESIKLPSTSPANASWSFERKLAAWSDLMARHGLL
jgi:hypoxanthine-DNA glycosylase